ncbi:carboxypeptidase-like regulatory domain-containing protein [Pedobacter aquatilis]|uniref:carboxypeptidase-like regulatory domain-containing protein n=1 Tax=Pedobacter aquatilis TaxID=351343 RepID=UPI00292D87AB|nr:carboxypeptidase-like regulatory domain-containing protein [Pedobacter aquatilis]
MFIKPLLSFLFTLATLGTLAQDSTGLSLIKVFPNGIKSKVFGKVTNEDGLALPAVSIKIKNKAVGTITDSNGNYSLEIDANDKLTFSFIGFNQTEISALDSAYSSDLFKVTQEFTNRSVANLSANYLPVFPDKVPPASAAMNIPVKNFKNARTIKDINEKLITALDGCGYVSRRYYAYDNGFALVTQMEQTDNRGYSLTLPDRWTSRIQSDLNSPWSYLKALINAPVGYFRVIVFLVADANPNLTGPTSDLAKAQQWLSSGALSVPSYILSRSLTSDSKVSLLIYQYKKTPGETAVFMNPSEITPKDHYNNSKIAAKIR